MDKSILIGHFKKNEKDKLVSYLQSLIPDTNKSVPKDYLKILEHFGKPFEERDNGQTLYFSEDGFEISELYTTSYEYRVPANYSVSLAGIHTNGIKICSSPFVPIKVLIIDNGRYPSVFKVARIDDRTRCFTSTVADLCSGRKHLKEMEIFIQECVKLNKIDTMEFI